MKRKLVLLFFCCLSLLTAFGRSETNDYVLCINSYTIASPWSNRVIAALADRIQSEPRVNLNVEHMRSMLINDEEAYNLYRNDILKRYSEKKPKALVLLGNPAFSLIADLRRAWGDIPIILYASLDYTSRTNYYIGEDVIPLKDRIPIKDLQDEFNVTLLQSRIFVAENIANIVQRTPNLQSIIFLRDSRHVNYELEEHIRYVLSNDYPWVRLEVLESDVIEINDLINRLNSIDTEKVAVLFSSWSYKSDLKNFSIVVANTNYLIGTSDIPLYTLNFADIVNSNGVMHSGVTFDWIKFRQKLVGTLGAVLSGVSPRDIPFYIPKESYTYVNYDIAKSKNIDLSHLDNDVIVLNPPRTFLEKYALWILITFAFFVVIFFSMYRYNRLKIQSKLAVRENDLNKALKLKAEESSRLKSAFLANMSHEIRTPLNAIVGFSELMKDTTDENDKKEYVEIIKMNNNMLLRLIGDILDLSKLEAGMSVINPTTLDLVETLNNSYSYWSRRFAEKNIQFELLTPCEVCKVCLDEKSLLQVLTNFLSNAFKYTVAGRVSLQLEIKENGVKLLVKDTGIGIPADKQLMVFGRFAKLNEFAQGAGLGLSICKALTELSGGEIGFSSEEGIGSIFWVFFPTEVTVSEKKKKVARDNKDSLIKSSHGNKTKKILVAEDNESNYKLTEAILKNDYELVRAINGEVAITLFSQDVFDAVLMDMRMPVMDGLTAVKKIRKFNKHTPMVAITANAFDTDRIAALDAGCNGFHSKPLNKARLIKDLEQLIEKSPLCSVN